MQGRNGADDLSRFASIGACVLIVLNIFLKFSVIYYLGLALLIYAYFRMFSKNIYKRRAENDAFLRKKNAIADGFYNRKDRFSQKKDYCFFKCPSCKTMLRVPRGKGRIRITCRKCGTAFEKKT